MLDPWTALGLAASVVQFIDFSAKLIADTKEIHQNASCVEVKHLREVTLRLISLNSDLRERLSPKLYVKATQAEQALDSIASECTEVAADLIACLQKVTLRDERSKWASIRAALQTTWNRNRVEALASRLRAYREQMALQLLALLNAQNDRQLDCLNDLMQKNEEIIEVLSINQNTLEKQGETQHLYSEHNAQKRHDETIAAILTMKNGNVHTIVRPPEHGECSQNRKPSLAVRYYKTKRKDDEDSTDATMNDYSPIAEKILDFLFFRQITDRVENITEAYDNTFQWIFAGYDPLDVPQNNFKHWLERGRGIYWINGKAGSGKSTLMKYISEENRTRSCLSNWAGSHQLITASHFFYHLGSNVQKSHLGLLRSVLFEILQENSHLIPHCFPNLFRAVAKEEDLDDLEPSFAELKKAFVTLLNHDFRSLRICIFVDGIDEYNGELSHLLDLFSLVESSSSMKMILSSRPTAECVAAFSKHQGIRLQDLTFEDISSYVESNLCSHPNMKLSGVLEEAEVTNLIQEVTAKASGVFLWVTLVVKSLVSGLENFDRVSDLRRRLDELPGDLENLYKHIIGQMKPFYRREASKYLQLALRSTEIQTDVPIDALQFSFAEEGPVVLTGPLSRDEINFRIQATEKRLVSRCCGLLETQETCEGRAFAGYPCVRFLHKTVAEVLQQASVWQSLVDLTATTPFNADMSLLSSCVCWVKARSFVLTDRIADESIWLLARYVPQYAGRLDKSLHSCAKSLLLDLEETLSLPRIQPIIRPREKCTNHNCHQFGRINFDMLFRSCSTNDEVQKVSFISWIALSGAEFYLEMRLKDKFRELNTSDKTLILTNMVVYLMISNDTRFLEPVSNSMELLVHDKAADPNATVYQDGGLHGRIQMYELEGYMLRHCSSPELTPWKTLLIYLHSLTSDIWTSNFWAHLELVDREVDQPSGFSDASYCLTVLSTVKQMLRLGADVNCVCDLLTGRGSLVIPALAIIHRFFHSLQKFLDRKGHGKELNALKQHVRKSHTEIFTVMTKNGAQQCGCCVQDSPADGYLSNPYCNEHSHKAITAFEEAKKVDYWVPLRRIEKRINRDH